MAAAEILAPAGSEETAYAALDCGADAIYLGMKEFSARASAENFDTEALSRVSAYAHMLGAKVYVALNTLVKDSETGEFFRIAKEACNAGADAILIQDMFLGKKLRELYPEICLHLSTQAGCCNEAGARLAKEYGFSRVVLARETPLSDIERISKIIETEVFIQGALCTCFSGQCYLSSFAGNNSGNRGRCKQPCRKKYSFDREGYEEQKYALSVSDLSVRERVKELVAAGAYSLKIEGRLRRVEYVRAAVSYYRALLDGRDGAEAFRDLKRTYNRGDYTSGLAFGQKKDFLSRDVQGHIGEEVGKITYVKGKPYCKSAYRATLADGFKILRNGEEVGGARAEKTDKSGFYLSSREHLYEGDSVRLTTDSKLSEKTYPARKKKVVLSLRFQAG